MISRDIKLPANVYFAESSSIYQAILKEYNSRYDIFYDSIGACRYPEECYLTKVEAATKLLNDITNKVEEDCKIIDKCLKIIRENTLQLSKKELVYKFYELPEVYKLQLKEMFFHDRTLPDSWVSFFRELEENDWLTSFEIELEKMIDETR